MPSHSSGDLLIDRRFAWAEALAADGDHAAASDLLAEITAAVPDWAAGWRALAQAREASGDPSGALPAWRHVAALDPDGFFGADLHLARLGGSAPPAMPDRYLEALFDDYAPRFEDHLVDRLGYCGPALIVEALDRVAPERRFARALDLGCGTGLMAQALAGRVDRIDGVDLSPRMLEAAQTTGCYASLSVLSIEAALAEAAPGRYDLVVAADVLPYLGDLSCNIAGIARMLGPGGLFAFTAQRCDGERYELGADLRFAHSPAYIETALRETGLIVASLERLWARRENGRPVPGLVGVATSV